ncbi:MAG: hypothetical protein Q4D51_00540 [Eubacteriales bacterium]|nr:hypothetical protein [Eubacteriales bacterium]
MSSNKKKFKAVSLKYLDDDTIANIRIWRNQDFVKTKMYSQHEISEEEHKNYIKSIKENPNRGLFVFYLDDQPFGVYQYTITPEDNSVTGGNYLVDEEYVYMGYGMIQIYFMGVIKFDVLKCDREYEETLDTNTRILTLAKKMGGKPKLIPEKRCLLEDGYHDVYKIEGFASDWEKNKTNYENVVFKVVEKQFEIIL